NSGLRGQSTCCRVAPIVIGVAKRFQPPGRCSFTAAFANREYFLFKRIFPAVEIAYATPIATAIGATHYHRHRQRQRRRYLVPAIWKTGAAVLISSFT